MGNPNRIFDKRCDRFSGNNDKIEVDSWIKVFELQTELMTDRDRIKALSRHLTDDALNWFAIDGMSDDMNWNAVRNGLIKRFSRAKPSQPNETDSGSRGVSNNSFNHIAVFNSQYILSHI